MDHKEAYILGLMFSDGCVCKTTNNRHTVNFGNKIRSCVKVVAEYFGSNIIVGTANKKRYYRTSICNIDLFNRMNEYGCIMRKTHILKKPNIPEKYIWSFLCGFFDGDGSISCNRSINSWKVSIGIASKDFSDWLISILNQNNILYNYEIRKTKTGKFYNITMCGIMGKHFLSLCYTETLSICLKSKYNRYKKLCSIKLKNPSYNIWELELLEKYPLDIAINKINTDNRNFGWIREKRSAKRTLINKKRN